MSGHNKWSKIKNKKAVTDAAKSKTFSKMAKLISTASKEVGGDTSSPVLKSIIEKARAENMPAENIERAVKKGVRSDASDLESIIYEAYGPGGSAIVIEAMTENRNKAAQEIKFILTKHGSSLATRGAVLWAFDKNGDAWNPKTTIILPPNEVSALTLLINDLEGNDEVENVYTNVQR